MATVSGITENHPSDLPGSRPHVKQHRILACVLCQQRKVKCDRQFPCSNCVKSRVQCVPSTLTQRKRKRRFGDRELLDHLRKYEDLLRANNIPFEPLHQDWAPRPETSNTQHAWNSGDEMPETTDTRISTPSTTIKSDGGYQPKNVWHAMSQGFRDPGEDSDSSQDEVREAIMKKAWEQSFGDDELLLFGSRATNIDLSALHPDPVQIFKLWQVYLDNVNPLLKVTHIPSLQGRIIEAVSNMNSITPTMEALMFSIYCTALASLSSDACQAMFAASQDDILTRYRYGCQQALVKCGFLRTDDRDCLTAFFLFLVSARLTTVPHSLATILGCAIRIAQRMAIYSEAALSQHPPFEAEMRRRLWWALVLFDTRVCETTSHRVVTLEPTWDCRVPLNVNDSDLRPEMKELPAMSRIQTTTTDALFAVVRCRLGDFIRHNELHLDITNPALNHVARNSPRGQMDLGKLESEFEEQYFKDCDEGNALHYMSIWTTRANIAKFQLVLHCLENSDPSVAREQTHRDIAASYALKMLQCDTKIMSSPLTRGFLWLHKLHFPFPAYLRIAQDLRTRPFNNQSRQAWEILSENFDAWAWFLGDVGSPIFLVFTKMILSSWEASKAPEGASEPSPVPKIISSIREILGRTSAPADGIDVGQWATGMDINNNDFSTSESLPMNLVDQSLPYELAMHDRPTFGPDIYSGMAQQSIFGLQDPFTWNPLRRNPGWGGF